MRVKLIGILLLTVFLQEKSSAQAIDIAEIDQLTAKAMKHLTTFSRYAYKTKMYGDMEFGKNVGSETSSAYFGQNTGILHIFAVVQIEKKSEEKLGIWINNDQQITTKDANASTVIIRLDVPWVSQKESDAFASFRNNMGLGHFVFPASANKYGHSLNPDSFPYEELRNTTTSIIESTYQSRPCYKVLVTTTLNSSLKPISTEYLLDKQHGMVLAQRQKGVLHIPKGSRNLIVLDVDQVTEVSYGPPTENGLPFPTAVKGWYVWPTGRREPMTDVEFTEFKRYTPTADELDFEKQFGIPLPSLPPKPGVLTKAGSSRATKWLAGGLGVTVVAAIVIFIFHRRTVRRSGFSPAKAEKGG